MENTSFTTWCQEATEKIRYVPDRRMVSQELMDHLEDHRDALMAQGLTQEEAEKKALEAMGSAEEIAPQLGTLYNPFWGYVIITSRRILAILLVMSLLPIWKYFKALNLQDISSPKDFEYYTAEYYGDDTGRTLHHLSRPDVSFRSDGNTFTVTNTVLLTEYSVSSKSDVTRLCLLVDEFSLLPAAEHGKYDGLCDDNTSICSFFIRDDKGSVYPLLIPRRWCYSVQNGVFRQTHVCIINNFPADAKWIDLCYERDGRSFSLRIDLTGGGDE